MEALPTATGIVSTRGWLATLHFLLATLFLFGHIWHAIRARGAEAGFDFAKGDVTQLTAARMNVTQANSDFSLKFLSNLPIYRRGMAPISRGLEVGMAHGYWLLGAFAWISAWRGSDTATLTGLITTSLLIVAIAVGLSLYGSTRYEQHLETVPRPAMVTAVPYAPEAIQTAEGWSLFTSGFLIGGIGGAIFAYLLLSNLELLRQFV